MLGLYTLSCDAELYTPDTMSGSKWNTGDGVGGFYKGCGLLEVGGTNMEGRSLAPPHPKTSPAATGR